MSPIIISFFTRDWIYPQHAARLAAECHRLKLDHHIELRESRGGYLQNTCQKPAFIRDMLNFYQKPVLWVDVDGSILKKPIFFNDLQDADICAKRMHESRKRMWHVGTMWFDYNPQVMAFIDRWVEVSGELSDESALEAMWREFPDMKIVDMPPEYFQCEATSKMPRKQIVIFHRSSNWQSKKDQVPRFNNDRPQKPV